jgi:predicted O-linked N-acetylglucosamine transferase (SPINDLY family)
MLFQEDDDTLSFISLLKSIQTETNVLKCVSSLRSLPQNDKLTSKIFEIENAVQNIEKNLEDFNEFLSSEMKTCEIMDNEIINIAEQQARKINELHMSYPQSLVAAIKNSKESTEDKKDQNMYVFTYRYMYIYMYVYIYIDVYIHMFVYIYIYVYLYRCIYTYVYIYLYMYLYTCRYLSDI